MKNQHSSTSTAPSNDSISEFLSSFGNAPKGDPLTKARHWLSLFQSLETTHTNIYELRHRRTLARQNLRRLIQRHPGLLSQLQKVGS